MGRWHGCKDGRGRQGVRHTGPGRSSAEHRARCVAGVHCLAKLRRELRAALQSGDSRDAG
jgi:hypothetical protein